MNESRRQAYLEAMGFDVWVMRPPEPERDRLVIGPGQGSTLLVCAAPEHTASKLGGDIARALGGDPVWAWPDPEGSPDRPSLEQAVEERLFTHVVVFGKTTAGFLFGKQVPDVLVSSAVTTVPGMEELETRGTAKLELWNQLKQGGLCGPPATP